MGFVRVGKGGWQRRRRRRRRDRPIVGRRVASLEGASDRAEPVDQHRHRPKCINYGRPASSREPVGRRARGLPARPVASRRNKAQIDSEGRARPQDEAGPAQRAGSVFRPERFGPTDACDARPSDEAGWSARPPADQHADRSTGVDGDGVSSMQLLPPSDHHNHPPFRPAIRGELGSPRPRPPVICPCCPSRRHIGPMDEPVDSPSATRPLSLDSLPYELVCGTSPIAHAGPVHSQHGRPAQAANALASARNRRLCRPVRCPRARPVLAVGAPIRPAAVMADDGRPHRVPARHRPVRPPPRVPRTVPRRRRLRPLLHRSNWRCVQACR
jgi:hypothetical protein